MRHPWKEHIFLVSSIISYPLTVINPELKFDEHRSKRHNVEQFITQTITLDRAHYGYGYTVKLQ